MSALETELVCVTDIHEFLTCGFGNMGAEHSQDRICMLIGFLTPEGSAGWVSDLLAIDAGLLLARISLFRESPLLPATKRMTS